MEIIVEFIIKLIKNNHNLCILQKTHSFKLNLVTIHSSPSVILTYY